MNSWLERARGPAAAALLALAAACSPQAPAASAVPQELNLYAAASLRDVLAELAPLLEAELSIKLVLNLGSSGDLARQIEAAGKADVFISADEQEMDRLDALGLVEVESRRDLLGNALVVIEAVGGSPHFKAPFEARQLAQDGIDQISLANVDSVPAGRYAKAWLEAQGVWPGLRGRIVPGVDVRAALAAVESGAVPAGIVYRTDAARSNKVRVVFEVPREQGPAIRYPIAQLRGRASAEASRRLIAWLATPAARARFERHGFVALGEGD